MATDEIFEAFNDCSDYKLKLIINKIKKRKLKVASKEAVIINAALDCAIEWIEEEIIKQK